MLNRSREVNHEFEYDLYELATLSEDGKLLDRRQLPSASALSGLEMCIRDRARSSSRRA